MRNFSILLLSALAGLLLAWACTPEEEIITDAGDAQLVLGADTVSFDTLFTTVGSTTQWLSIYNPNQRAVNISSITLGNASSPYRVIVNGKPGSRFQDVRLLGGDSLLVLIEVTVDPQDEDIPFLIKDSLIFQTNGNVQDVKLEAWGQNAYFLKSAIIAQDTTFATDRPYVVCDSLWVQQPATLTLPPGVKMYFNNGASLLVDGSLQAQGKAEARIPFQHIRTDGDFENALGQWAGIFFGPKSKDNILAFAEVRNAQVGIVISSPDNDTIPDLILANTVIENMSDYGIFAIDTDITAYNTVVSNCVSGLVANFGRGDYRYWHCTFVNEYTSFIREDSDTALLFGDTLFVQNNLTQRFSLSLINNIIWGSLPNELGFDARRLGSRVIFDYNLIQSTDTTRQTNNIVAQNPMFVNSQEQDYRLNSLSPAINAGIPLGITQDLEGNPRDAQPDWGAYEYIKE